MCAALCASKGAATAIHEAADSVAPLKVRSYGWEGWDIYAPLPMALQPDEYSRAPAEWLVRQAGMLVGELCVKYGGEWHSIEAPTFIHLPPLQPLALRVSGSADTALLDAFGYNRLTKLELTRDDDRQDVEALLAALISAGVMTQLQDLEIADCCDFPSAADFFAPLTRLTRLAFGSFVEPNDSDLLPAAMLQSLPQSPSSCSSPCCCCRCCLASATCAPSVGARHRDI